MLMKSINVLRVFLIIFLILSLSSGLETVIGRALPYAGGELFGQSAQIGRAHV